MNPSAITVGTRFRKDLGSLDDLMDSIRTVGLLQPIVIDQGNRLIVGERRLQACLALGMDDVPVCVIDTLTDAADLVRAERDENTCRKDMTIPELVALGRRLEELERPRARARMEAGKPDPEVPGTQGVRGPETRDVVGSAIGMSGATYQRAKAVVEAAEDAEAPEEVREVAQAALAEMETTGKVVPAYAKVRRARQRVQSQEPSASAPDVPGARQRKPRLHHRNGAALVSRFLTQINGIAAAIDGVDFAGCQLDETQIHELDAGIRVILAARKTLKENSL